MRSKSSTKKNLFYQLSYQFLLLALPFITSPYIARVIGAEGLGIYSYSHSVACYFEILALLGIANYGNRLIAQSRDDKDLLNRNFSNLLCLHIIISIVACIAYGVYIHIDVENSYYARLQWPYVICSIFDISWFYFGIEDFKTTVVKNFIIKISTVILIFTLVKGKGDIWLYCLIMALASLASTTSLWLTVRKHVSFVKPSWSEIKKHLLPMLILFIPTVALSIYKYMDKIMIGGMSSKVELGYYENAEKVSVMAVSVINAFGTVMLPKMSNMFSRKDESNALSFISKCSEIIMCLAFGMCFGIVSISTIFSVVFWGDEFKPAGIVLLGLAITIPFAAFANIIRTQYLIPKEKDKEYSISVVVGAVVNFAVNYALIPSLGAWGAAIGTISAEASVCVLQALFVRKELPILSYIRKALLYVPVGVIMFFSISLVIKKYDWSWKLLIISVLLGLFIYGLISFGVLLLSKNTIAIAMLKKFNRNKRRK